jgi:hypothetical protein
MVGRLTWVFFLLFPDPGFGRRDGLHQGPSDILGGLKKVLTADLLASKPSFVTAGAARFRL